MKTIIRGRDSGKARELLQYARKNNCFIITQDKRAFKVKAHNYGFDDIIIVDYEDLKNDDYPIGMSALIHNGDKMLVSLLDKFYGIDVQGMTATVSGGGNNGKV